MLELTKNEFNNLRFQFETLKLKQGKHSKYLPYVFTEQGVAMLSSVSLAFGLYHVHSLSNVTEGGVLGLNLLLEHWFHITPSITNFVANVLCYALGWKLLGRKFIIYSAVRTICFNKVNKVTQMRINKKYKKNKIFLIGFVVPKPLFR